MKPIIAVVGGSTASAEVYQTAREAGAEIAAAGAVLVTGGLCGVMEAASQGDKEKGGGGPWHPARFFP